MADIDDLADTASEPDRSEDPIDADFEPAPTRSPLHTKPARKGGPGWFGVAVASLMAAGTGGAIGIALDGKPSASSAVGNAEIVDIRAAQEDMDISFNKLVRDVAESENRLQEQMKTLLAGDGDREGLQALVADLNLVSQRLDEAMAAGGADASVGALADIGARLDALETPGDEDGGSVSPRAVTRAVSAMNARLDKIEAAQREIEIGLEARTDALEKINDRMTDVELSGPGGEEASGGGLALMRADIEALKTDLEDWRVVAAETAGSAAGDIEKYETLIAALQARESADQGQSDTVRSLAKAALALSAIEAAARRGRSFEAEYARLKSALPGDATVNGLAAIAELGAPTRAELRAGFETATGAAEKAAEPASTGGGWGWIHTVFGDAVSYTSNDADAEAARENLQAARAAMRDNDLSGALGAARQLSGAPGEAMSDWIEGAERRITLEEGLEHLRFTLSGAEQ